MTISNKLKKILCVSASALMFLSVMGSSTNSINVNARHRTRINRVRKHRPTKRLRKIHKPYAYVDKASSWPVDITDVNGYKDVKKNTIVKILNNKPWNYEGGTYTKVRDGKLTGYIPSQALSQYPNKKVNLSLRESGYASLCDQINLYRGKEQDTTYNRVNNKYKDTSLYKLGFREGRRDTAMMKNRRDRANGDEFDPYLAMKGENLLIKDLTSNHHCYNEAYKAGFVQGYIHGDPDLFTVPYTPKRDLAWGGVREDKDDANSQYYGDRDDANDLINFAKKYMHTKGNKAKQKLIYNNNTLLYGSLHDAKVQLFTDVDEEDVNPHTTHGKTLNHEVKEIMSDKDFY